MSLFLFQGGRFSCKPKPAQGACSKAAALLFWNISSISGEERGPHCAGAGTCPLPDTFLEVSPKMPCENMSSPGTLRRTEKEGGSVRRKVRVGSGKMLAWENGRGFGKEAMMSLLYQAPAWPFLEYCTQCLCLKFCQKI